MAHHHHGSNRREVKILEQCQVSPPQGSLPAAAATTLPLTFFDIPWFLCHPVQRIFFYHFPHPTQHFLQSPLPALKHSLSLTLQHFFPFSSNLIVPPHPLQPFIRYNHGRDSVSFTVAESQADFNLLVSDSPQDVRDWHPLVPSLPPHVTLEDGTRVMPLMAIQVTVLPNAGFSICLSFNHLAADGKSLHHFMKFWANVCKQTITREGSDDLGNFLVEGSLLSLPSHDRDTVKDPKGLKHLYLEDLKDWGSKRMEFQGLVKDVFTNKVRGTLVLTRGQIENLKRWVSLNKYCESTTSGKSSHMSTFVVTCSLIWVCMIESEQKIEGSSNTNNSVTNKDFDDEICYLVFLADCRDRPELSIPSNYFGNCLMSGSVEVKRDEIVGENGIVEVASAIEREVRDLKSDALKKAETLMSSYRELGEQGKSVLVVAGSPRLAVYETDFGWGKPEKSESVHLDTSGSISLSDSRDNDGAIEVGFALERTRMNKFINIFEQHLNDVDRSLSLSTNHRIIKLTHDH